MSGQADRDDDVIRIQPISDFHAEMSPRSLPGPAEVATDADIVIMAGDMARASDSTDMTVATFPRAMHAVEVGGNHSHYLTHMSIPRGLDLMHQRASALRSQGHSIHVLEDESVVLDVRGVPVRVIGTTLWTDYELFGDAVRDSRRVRSALNDYRLISSAKADVQRWLSNDSITPVDVAELAGYHARSRAYLEAELGRAHDGPTIVVTHHLPSMRSVAPHYRGDPVSAGFASNLDDVIALGPQLWVHGHTHSSALWRDGDSTLVVCNPAGYAGHGLDGGRENPDYNPGLVIDIRRNGPDNGWRASVATEKAVEAGTR